VRQNHRPPLATQDLERELDGTGKGLLHARPERSFRLGTFATNRLVRCEPHGTLCCVRPPFCCPNRSVLAYGCAPPAFPRCRARRRPRSVLGRWWGDREAERVFPSGLRAGLRAAACARHGEGRRSVSPQTAVAL
jgi:hypothetical protein